MRGAFPRVSKLSSVRLALSKLDAKYSKTSVAINDFSDEAEAEDNELAVSQIQDEKSTEFLDADSVQMLPQVKDISVILVNGLCEQGNVQQGDAEWEQQGTSPLFQENFSLETASSFESVQTDSVLALYNVHLVSSLAESVLPEDEVEPEIFPTSNAKISRLNSPTPLMSTSSTENCGSSKSNSSTGRNGQVKMATSSDSSKIKLIQKPSAKTYTIDESFVPAKTLNLEHKLLFPVGDVILAPKIMDNNATGKSSASTNESHRSEKRVTHHCNCYGLVGHKKKSIGVQTSESPCLTVKPFIGCNRMKSRESSSNIPVIKATKLPLFLKDNFTKPACKLICSLEKDELSSELSELISHHLYLTKEFLERQHRIYIANCKAVQLLEKGYQENAYASIRKCTHRAS